MTLSFILLFFYLTTFLLTRPKNNRMIWFGALSLWASVGCDSFYEWLFFMSLCFNLAQMFVWFDRSYTLSVLMGKEQSATDQRRKDLSKVNTTRLRKIAYRVKKLIGSPEQY